MKHLGRSVLAVLMASSLGTSAWASYSQVIAFGDSLSDNGNLYALTGQPGAPFFEGRFSNGIVAVEVMANTLGLNLQDYAYGGAQTGTGNLSGAALEGTGVTAQVGNYAMAASGSADANALFVVWAGPNDFFAGTNMFSQNTAPTASSNLLSNIQALYNLGARDFFIPLMPDLGITPAATLGNLSVETYSAVATAQTQAYNGFLRNGLQSLSSELSDIRIQTFDTAAFVAAQVQVFNALGQNTTGTCLNVNTGEACANPDNFLFWDNVHPTAIAHNRLGLAFAAAVPEAQTYLLMGLGLVGLAWATRRRQNATA